MGSTLIALTIYVSLLSYLLAVVCWVTCRRGPRYRIFWTVGCLFLWAHAFCAFHFYHGWSHAHAVQLTAKQTQEVMGYAYGDGIWFSYLLLVIWLVDVVQLWRAEPESGRSNVWLYFSYGVHAYAFFILFNGTVVFEEGLVRWGGMVGTLWVIRLAWRFRRVPLPSQSTELTG